MTASCHFNTRSIGATTGASTWYKRARRQRGRRRRRGVGAGLSSRWNGVVPRAIAARAAASRASRSDFFWRPFRPADFSGFPWRSELLQGMLGADLPDRFPHALLRDPVSQLLRAHLGLRVDRARDEVATRRGPVRVGVFPLGIPADYFAGLAASPRVRSAPAHPPRAAHTTAWCWASIGSTTTRASPSSACARLRALPRPARHTIGASRWC